MAASDTLLRLGPIVAALSAIWVGLLCSPLSRHYPLFHWLIPLSPSLIGLTPSLAPQPWGYTFERLERTDLKGQAALVTGANSGIGFEIARALSRQGARVTMACRNPQRCFSAADKIRKEEGYSGAEVAPLVMDVSDLKSVQRAAKTYLSHDEEGKLDMLFLNAGIFYDPPAAGAATLPLSKDGIEKVFATNVVGHHLLYRLLEPLLKNATMARVVSTSSIAGISWLPPYALPYRFGAKSPIIPSTLEELNAGNPSTTIPNALYGRSKLAQMSWSRALTRRLGGDSDIYVNSAHPGAVHTAMTGGKNFPAWLPRFVVNGLNYLMERALWSPREGALTELYLGVAADDVKEKDWRGEYFHPQGVRFDHPYAGDEELQENVWGLCEELVKDYI